VAELPKDDAGFESLPKEVRKIILSLLSLNPDDRPASAAELRDKLKLIMSELGLVCDRQDLSRFISQLLINRIGERHRDEIRISRRIKEFLLEEVGDESGQITRTVVPPPEPIRDATQVLVTDWKKEASSGYWGRISSQRSYLIGVGGIIMLALIVAVIFWGNPSGPDKALEQNTVKAEPLRTPPEIRSSKTAVHSEPEIQKEQAVPAHLAEEPLTLKAEEAAKKEIIPENRPSTEEDKKAATDKFGQLYIQAIPWGYVYAGKSGRRYETPVSGLKLPTGLQRLRVTYPPTGDQLHRNVEIKAGEKLTCIARFGAKKGLRCY
jgi:hypothetical protein